MDKNYKGLIWTNHAMERMQKRGISQGDAWATWRNPDQSRKGKTKGTWVYYKIYPASGGAHGTQKIEVVAKPPAQRATGPAGKSKWVILSVWSRPAKKGKRPKVLSLSKEKKSFTRTLLDTLLGK